MELFRQGQLPRASQNSHNLEITAMLKTHVTLTHFLCVCFSLFVFCADNAAAQEDTSGLIRATENALQQACTFYVNDVAVRGGYVYYYSPDLKTRLGEGPASATQIWVQAPGTPTVGLAFLAAYDATSKPAYLEAAVAAGKALVYGQLKSGAWTNSIDFDPQGETAAYRNGRGRGRNFSTLDDGISQTALQFLMKLDQATDFRDAEIHTATIAALQALLDAQFTNGAFPQGWDDDSDGNRPAEKANFPEYDWRTEGRIKNYWDMATLNDGMAVSITETLIVAHETYQTDLRSDQQTYLPSLKRFGRWLIDAQLPEPQPGWAQQYNDQMQPIWARRFEPPAVAGRESQDVMQALLHITEFTQEPQYLTPIPAALHWIQKSQLPDGRIARYYELKTNRPLYMIRSGKQYSLTYNDNRLPGHYGWKVENRHANLKADYQNAINKKRAIEDEAVSPDEVRRIIADLDGKGRWVTTFRGEPLPGQPRFRTGDQYISSAVFAERVHLLSDFLKQSRR